MPMQAVSGRIRLGILVLPISAVLVLAGTLIGGSGAVTPTGDVGDHAEFAASTRAAISNFLFAIGQLVGIFGFVALYACMAAGRAERWAFFAMILCVPGIAASFAYSVGTSGVEAVAAEQYLRGRRAVLEEWFDLFDWTSVFSLVLNPVLLSIGLVLFGVAIWRSQTLPQGAAILWFAVVLFQMAAALTWWAVAVSFLLLAITGGWIAWAVWRQPSARVGGVEAQPRVQ